jgi:hypothetical protein
MRSEGLGRPRIDRSIRPDPAGATTPQVFRSGGLALIDDDFHIRLIMRPSTGIGTRTLFAIEYSSTLRVAIGVVDDDLTLVLTSGYTLSFPNVLLLDDYNFLDVSVDRDGSGGNALAIVYLNGIDLLAPAHSMTIPDIPAGAGASIFDGRIVAVGAAAAMDFAFVGFEHDRIMTLARHRLDAFALEVP